jgi:hypothetical protein
MTDEPIRGWRVSKEIPLINVLAIFLQTFFFVWWCASINFRVEQHDTYIKENQNYKEKIDGNNEATKERLIKLEDKTSSELEMLQRMDAVLEQQPSRKVK